MIFCVWQETYLILRNKIWPNRLIILENAQVFLAIFGIQNEKLFWLDNLREEFLLMVVFTLRGFCLEHTSWDRMIPYVKYWLLENKASRRSCLKAICRTFEKETGGWQITSNSGRLVTRLPKLNIPLQGFYSCMFPPSFLFARVLQINWVGCSSAFSGIDGASTFCLMAGVSGNKMVQN